MYESLEEFPLRQVRFVRTRNSVLKATVNLLKQKEFNEITVDEICRDSNISRGTFFNYFPQKEYVFYYYIRIFTIKIMLRIGNWDHKMTFREQIKDLYRWFNSENRYPDFIKYYIYYLLDGGSYDNSMKLSEAEFTYYFSGIESEDKFKYYNKLTIMDIIKGICAKAKDVENFSPYLDLHDMARIVLGILLIPYITDNLIEGGSSKKELLDIMVESFYKTM